MVGGDDRRNAVLMDVITRPKVVGNGRRRMWWGGE